MQAYLINPKEKTIGEIDLDYKGKGIKAIYEAGNYSCFGVIQLNLHQDKIYIDEEGWLKPFSDEDKFWIKGYPHFLVGKGIVLGMTKTGEVKAPAISIKQLTQLIAFTAPA